MKHLRKILYMAVAIASLASLASCDIDSSPNGKLDGYWKMASIDSIESGNILNLDNELYFWAFQNKLLQLVDRGHKNATFLLRFEKSGKTLTVTDPYRHKSQLEDVPVEDPSTMKAYGIKHAEEDFTIKKLSNSTLILENEEIRINFKRY